MDFNLPEELQMLKQNLRRFVDTELIPIERETMDGNEMKPGMQEMLEEKAKALGLWMFDVPEEFGGLGLGALAKAVMWEELSRTIALPSRNASLFGPRVSPILAVCARRRCAMAITMSSTVTSASSPARTRPTSCRSSPPPTAKRGRAAG